MNQLSIALSARTLRRAVPALILAGGALLAALAAGPALADRDEHEGHERHGSSRTATPAPPAYAQECGSCHLAFPPGMLPAASWHRLMGRLDRHYGTDASLDAATRDRLQGWLQQNAATGRRAGSEPPEDRITRSAWFVRQHDEVRADVWRRASVRSAANCSACHPRADKGDFNEHGVRIPR